MVTSPFALSPSTSVILYTAPEALRIPFPKS